MNLFASTEPSRKLEATLKARGVDHRAIVDRHRANLPASGVELLDYHLAHGGRVDDRNGDWLCWPIVPNDAEADA